MADGMKLEAADEICDCCPINVCANLFHIVPKCKLNSSELAKTSIRCTLSVFFFLLMATLIRQIESQGWKCGSLEQEGFLLFNFPTQLMMLMQVPESTGEIANQGMD